MFDTSFLFYFKNHGLEFKKCTVIKTHFNNCAIIFQITRKEILLDVASEKTASGKYIYLAVSTT